MTITPTYPGVYITEVPSISGLRHPPVTLPSRDPHPRGGEAASAV